MAFGYEGLGMFYTVLEKLAKQEQPIKTVVLKKQLFVGKKLEKCWKFMEEIGLLSSNNGETFNKQLLNFSEKYMIKSEKNKKRISEWREKQALAENVTRYESVRNTPKDKISKDKISKETPNPLKGERVFSISIPEGYETAVQTWLDYKRELKKPYKTQRTTQAMVHKLVRLSDGKPEVASVMIQTAIENGWQGFFKPTEESTTKETLHIAYEYACCMAGVKTDKERRWFLKEITKYPPEFIGVLAFYWKNAHDGEMKKIIEQHLIEEWADKKRYYGNYNRKTQEEHIAHWTKEVERMKSEL